MRKFLCLIFMFSFIFIINAKDIYVRAGSKSGNGTIEKPYGTIEEAMNMGVYAGDVIHVSEGVYYGEGGSGKIVIKVNNLTLVGGYSKDFKERNPFKYQTIFVRGMDPDLIEEAKKRGHDKKWGLDLTPTKASYNPNAMISGEGDSSNTIIDGFIIDGYTRNSYKQNGDLKIDVGPIGTPLISFNKKGCKVRNCIIMNSGGPGIQMVASGTKDDPDSWAEISNYIIVNTLMEAIDFRVGTFDPDRNPDSGYALIKNNSIAFVWSHLGEGYGILIGRQTKLIIENNIIAFATDFGMNNGFGNDKAVLKNNVFFNNMGGVYRYFAKEGSGTTAVCDDPTLLSGKQANKMYYLSSKSEGNITADPKFKPDPDFFDKFTNQIKSEGGGKVVWDEVNQWRSMMGLPLIGTQGTGRKNFAPIYEHDYMFLFSNTVDAGAKSNVSFQTYKSQATSTVNKEYKSIKFADVKSNFGKDVEVSVKVGDKDVSSYYVDNVTKDNYICYRFKDDQMNFLYVKKGTEALEIIEQSKKDGSSVIVRGTIYDISANIKSSNRYAIVVDEAELDE
ncbi:MAG TPA: right-handed parallel beta-helix repeat-containing protein [Spirochaetota bacterium]|nr:right-handed parallel beta-helix repeat-containing protein [Spirochaetota bacterium]